MQFLTLFAASIAVSAAVVGAAPAERGKNQVDHSSWQPKRSPCGCDDHGHHDPSHDGGEHNGNSSDPADTTTPTADPTTPTTDSTMPTAEVTTPTADPTTVMTGATTTMTNATTPMTNATTSMTNATTSMTDPTTSMMATTTASTAKAPATTGKGGEKVRVGYSLDLNPNTRLSSLSCSSVFAQKYPQFADKTLDELPTKPFYGEIPGATSGSPKCGSCWELQYDNKDPIYMIAVDNAAIFQLGKQGFERFAGQEGFNKGSVDAQATEVSPEHCHLSQAKR